MAFQGAAILTCFLINRIGDAAYFSTMIALIGHLFCLYTASKYSSLSELCLKQARDHEKREAFRRRCEVLAAYGAKEDPDGL